MGFDVPQTSWIAWSGRSLKSVERAVIWVLHPFTDIWCTSLAHLVAQQLHQASTPPEDPSLHEQRTLWRRRQRFVFRLADCLSTQRVQLEVPWPLSQFDCLQNRRDPVVPWSFDWLWWIWLTFWKVSLDGRYHCLQGLPMRCCLIDRPNQTSSWCICSIHSQQSLERIDSWLLHSLRDGRR